MDLVLKNAALWQTYEAGTTPHIEAVPHETVYERLEPGTTTLDIGCGEGVLAEELASHGLNVYGIDINLKAVMAAHERHSSVNYSVGNIWEGTAFATESIGFATLRYVLGSIHRPAWPAFTDEMERLLAPEGFVWLAEPLMSESFAARIALTEAVTGEPRTIASFKDPQLTETIRTPEELQKAIDEDKVSRISRLYTEIELLDLFPGFVLIDKELRSDTSPAGYELTTAVMLLQKQS